MRRTRMALRLLLITSLLLTSLFIGGAAYAEGEEDLPEPGITPDSPFYFLDDFGKNISMMFTFGAENKAKKALRYAGERLAEAEAMMLKNKVKETERAADEYDRFMEKVEKNMEEAAREGLTDNISERVAAATAKHLAVLERVKEKAPEKAREALERAREKSENGQVNALRALAKNKLEKALQICDDTVNGTMERVKNRVRVKGASDNSTSDNVTTGNVTADLDYAERIAELEDELITLAEEKGIDITALREKLAHSTANRLETLAAVYEKAPEKARKGLENAIENSVRKYERAVEKLIELNVSDNVTGNMTALQKLPEKIKDRLNLRFIEKGPTTGGDTE